MSGSSSLPKASPASPGMGANPGANSGDPSMEDILASIRKILSDDEAVVHTKAEAPRMELPADDILELDESMIVPEEPAVVAATITETATIAFEAVPASPPVPVPVPAPVPAPAPVPDVQSGPTADLMAPATAAAAASSVGALVRTLATERAMQVRGGGLTVEDIVREEIRSLLKVWLDENLPPMVERLVRAEIERVVGRGVS